MFERVCSGFLFKVILKGSSRNAFSYRSTSEPYREIDNMKEEGEDHMLSKERACSLYTHSQGTHSGMGPHTPLATELARIQLYQYHRPSQVFASVLITDESPEHQCIADAQ